MKKLLILIIATAALASCNNIQKRDEKIKTDIASYLSGRMDKDIMQKTDSIQLITVDSLTEKEMFRYMRNMDGKYLGVQLAVLKQDSVISSHQKNEQDTYRNALNTSTLPQDINDFNKYISELHKDLITDSLKIDSAYHNLTFLMHRVDSLSALFDKADDKKFAGYLVKANVYTHSISGPATDHKNFVVTKDGGVNMY